MLACPNRRAKESSGGPQNGTSSKSKLFHFHPPPHARFAYQYGIALKNEIICGHIVSLAGLLISIRCRQQRRGCSKVRRQTWITAPICWQSVSLIIAENGKTAKGIYCEMKWCMWRETKKTIAGSNKRNLSSGIFQNLYIAKIGVSTHKALRPVGGRGKDLRLKQCQIGKAFIDFLLFSWDKVLKCKALSFNSKKEVFEHGERNCKVVQ
jgi:hypothetical protein